MNDHLNEQIIYEPSLRPHVTDLLPYLLSIFGTGSDLGGGGFVSGNVVV